MGVSVLFKKINAFTLVEVLVTVAIVGIVSVIVLNNLMMRISEKTTVSKLTRFHSLINQSYRYAIQEYGSPSTWIGSDGRTVANAKTLRDNLLINMKVSKKCNTTTNLTPCQISNVYYCFDGVSGCALSPKDSSSSSGYAAASLVDGSALYFMANSKHVSDGDAFVRGMTPALKSTIGWVIVDLNGLKKPNKVGRDVFTFYITDDGVVPVGTKEETVGKLSYKMSDCYTKGYSCAAWVIQYKNMNYIRSKNCAWSNPSCK